MGFGERGKLPQRGPGRSLLCSVIRFDRTLIAVVSSVSAKGFKALVSLQSHRHNVPNTGHVLRSGQGDDNGDEST